MEVLALSAATVDHLPVEAAALVVVVLGAVVVRRRPRLALAGWLAAVCGLPVWVVVTLKVDLEPHVLASLGLVACLLPVAARRRGLALARFGTADALLLAVLAVSLVAAVAGRVLFTDTFVLAVQWTAAFFAGRLVGYRVPLPAICGAVAVAATVVAVLALAEFATGWNPFVLIPGHGAVHDLWASIQDRGGHPRVEGAFGSSIALGCSLAMAVPLSLVAPFRTAVRLVMVALMLTATVLTFSRVSLIAAVLGAVLTVLMLGNRLPLRLRAAVAAGLVVLAFGSFSLLSQVFSAAGAEAADSASYRGSLLELLPGLQPFGYASSLHVLPTGVRVFGSFRSIDDALLLLGLTYGWVPLALVVAALLLGVGCLLWGRATAPTIAVLAQIPAFATVALITQYASVAWFLAGLAVFSQLLPRNGAEPDAESLDGPADNGLARSPEWGPSSRPERIQALS